MIQSSRGGANVLGSPFTSERCLVPQQEKAKSFLIIQRDMLHLT